MKKRYMDIIPGRPVHKQPAPRPAPAPKPVVSKQPAPRPAPASKQPTPLTASPKKPAQPVAYGVIEDYAPISDRPKSQKPTPKSPDSTSPAPLSSKTFTPPAPAFINTEKIEKRPLSKNFYPRPSVKAEEPSTAPIAIITPPEKDSRSGLIIAIILTIILGAAAGTVAFLLFPR